MIELEPGSEWVSVAKAARALGITETAVRKRISAGTLKSRGQRGATEVLIQVRNSSVALSQPGGERSQYGGDQSRLELAAESMELRSRLADAREDRDRWYAQAREAREEARAERAAREAIERELRIALARS